MTKKLYHTMLIAMTVMAITGCASYHTAKPFDLSDTSRVSIGYVTQSTLPQPAYYATVEEVAEGKWELVKISDTEAMRLSDKQEVLYVEKDLRYVQPYFEYEPNTAVEIDNCNPWEEGYVIERGTFECNNLFFFDKSGGKYNPCNSQLTTIDMPKSVGKNFFAVITTLGLASGSHRYVDSDKVFAVIEQTDLLKKVGEYRSKHVSLAD
jgi:hypothetical protein